MISITLPFICDKDVGQNVADKKYISKYNISYGQNLAKTKYRMDKNIKLKKIPSLKFKSHCLSHC